MDSFDPSGGASAEPIPGVHLRHIDTGGQMSMQSFVIEAGATVPEHDHHQEQFGVVLQGELTFHVDDRTIVVGPGEAFTIPGGEPHAAANEKAETVRGFDIFAPPREPGYFEE